MSRRSSTSSGDGPTRTPTNDATADPEKGQAPVPRGRPTPFTHSLRDPEIAGPMAGFKKGLIGGLVITMLAVLPVLSIYWGAFWRAPQHAHNLDIAVIDLDGGAVGQAVRALFTSPQVTGRNVQLSYVIAGQGEFADAEAAKHHVIDEKAWGAVVVSAGASQDLQNAISSRSTTYNATNAITFYITTARNENAVPRLVTPQVTPALQRFVDQFAEANARNIAGTADLGGLLSTAPALVTRPVGFHTEDLRPFDVPVAAAVDFVGLIYLLVISFVVAMLNFGVRTGTGLNTLLNLRSLLIIRFAVPFILYFFMSWIYSFVSLAFQVPFSRYYGDGGFVLYWISSFLGMTALGLAVEALITVLTPRFIPYFLLLWIITNVSVAFFPIQVLPGIFRYGYAMPFYNVGQIVRTLLFDTKNHLGRNYGILIAWTALSCFTMALLTIVMRRKEMRDAAAAASARPAQ